MNTAAQNATSGRHEGVVCRDATIRHRSDQVQLWDASLSRITAVLVALL
ncbi:MAG: hypothetical protein MPJ50_06880 [Pirellulales bacterium]|nr:hypothetical protein [Pirellulales bacterium]